MIANEDLEQKLKSCDDVAYAKVEGDGYHYQLVIVSKVFSGKTKVARQQWVYSLLGDFITSGSLHALSMQTFSEQEWEEQRG